jgi:hypothetical protein
MSKDNGPSHLGTGQQSPARTVLARIRARVLKEVRSRGRRPSVKTRREYMEAYRRMREQGKTPNDFKQSANTFYAMRAAWTWGVLREMVEAVRSIGRPSGRIYPEKFGDIAELMRRIFADWERHKPDPERMNHNDVGLVGEFAQIREGPGKPPASKWRELKNLPEGWRDRILEAAKDSIYRLPVAAMSHTGCRPVEFVKGVHVRLEEDGRLTYTIKGAKYVEGIQGQRMRRITAPVNGLDAQIVRDAVQSAGGELTIVAASAKGLWSAVNRFAKKAFNGNAHGIAPLSMRHQMASDLKGEGVSRTKIGETLGHRVDKTGGAYGRPALAKGTRDFEVTATTKVKKTTWTKIVPAEPEIIPESGP